MVGLAHGPRLRLLEIGGERGKAPLHRREARVAGLLLGAGAGDLVETLVGESGEQAFLFKWLLWRNQISID